MDSHPTRREKLIAAFVVTLGLVAILFVVRMHPSCEEGAKLYAPFQIAKNDQNSLGAMFYRPLVCKDGRGWYN